MTVTSSLPYATKKNYCKQEIIGFQHPQEEEAMHLNCNKEAEYHQNILLGRTAMHGAGIPWEPLAPPAWLQPQAGDGAPREFLGHGCQCLVGVLPQFGEKCKVQDKDKFSAITWW